MHREILCEEERRLHQIEYGASPRATLYLNLAARANAMLHGRAYATPQDVKDIAHDVLRHRVILTYEAEADGIDSETVVGAVLDHVVVTDDDSVSLAALGLLPA